MIESEMIEISIINLLKNMFSNIIKQVIHNDINNSILSISLILEDHKTISSNDFKNINTDGCYYYNMISVSEVIIDTEKYQKIVLKYFKSVDEKTKYDIEESNKLEYDHRTMFEKLQLGLFLPEHPGFVTLLPRGLKIYANIKKIIKKCYNEHSYNEVRTPPMMNVDLWRKSGHFKNYANNMFIFEDCDMALKPMSCPAHALVFKNSRVTSLPYRIAEFGECFRNEPHGGLLGLKRTRFFTQDDGHIFCQFNDISSEIQKFLDHVYKIYNKFGFNDIKFIFATRPEKFHGDINDWNKIENSVINYLTDMKYNFEVASGEGAFYGPKIEFHIKDLHNRYWQCGTIQIDWLLTTLLDASCIINGEKIYPIVLHRAILGSMERFISMLLEVHHGLPIICNDLKVVCLVLNEAALESDYMKKLKSSIPSSIPLNIDCDFNKHISDRMKKWMELKPNYIIFVGDKEIQKNQVCARINNKNEFFDIDVFINKIISEVV